MKQWIIIVLVVLLVGGGAFGGVKMADLAEQLNELELNNVNLQLKHDSLQSNYKDLESKYGVLQSEYSALEAQYSSLESNHGKLQSEFSAFKSEHESLQSSHAKLQVAFAEKESLYVKLEAENKDLKDLLKEYEKVPHDYYSSGDFKRHSNTISELGQFLRFELVVPGIYRLNEFDCSESATYVEWALENAGFTASIAVGPTPWAPSSGYHAWVIAYTSGYEVAIEPTALTGATKFKYVSPYIVPGIVYEGDAGWQNYHEGHYYRFKNVFEAISHWSGTGEEWNWWEGFWDSG